MRLTGLSLTAALLLSASVFARGDVYEFNYSGYSPEEQGQGVVSVYPLDITIDTSKLLASHSTADSFETAVTVIADFGYNEQFGVFQRNGTIEFSSEEDTVGQVFEYVSNGTTQKPTPLVLFTGGSDDPKIATGTYLADVLVSGSSTNTDGEVTITDLTTASPVPEPSSLALLCTGVLGTLEVMRRGWSADQGAR